MHAKGFANRGRYHRVQGRMVARRCDLCESLQFHITKKDSQKESFYSRLDPCPGLIKYAVFPFGDNVFNFITIPILQFFRLEGCVAFVVVAVVDTFYIDLSAIHIVSQSRF